MGLTAGVPNVVLTWVSPPEAAQCHPHREPLWAALLYDSMPLMCKSLHGRSIACIPPLPAFLRPS